MSLVWFLYLIDVMSSLKVVLIALPIVLANGLIFATQAELELMYSKISAIGNIARRIIILIVVSVALASFIPSQKTMYMMAAAYAGEKLIQSQDFQETYGKLRFILNNKLDEIIAEELNGKSKK
jgi:hypothetical protein